MKELLCGLLAGVVLTCHVPIIYVVAWTANQLAHLVVR